MEPISKHKQHARPDEPLEKVEPRARSGRELSRRRPATMLGVRLCGPRAREQEGRFAAGRLGRKTATRARGARLFAAVAVALSVLAMAACGGAERGGASAANAKAGQESGGQESTPAAKTTASAGSEGDENDKAGARAGEAVARDGARAGEARAGAGARAGEATASTGGAQVGGNSRGDAGGNTGDPLPREVTLEITGDRRTQFSGACSVGGTNRTLDGRVPERYVFEPRGKRLECELRTEGGGALGIVLTDGAGFHSEQWTTAGEGTVKFTYANGSISSSTSSISEGRSVTYSDDSSSEGSP